MRAQSSRGATIVPLVLLAAAWVSCSAFVLPQIPPNVKPLPEETRVSDVRVEISSDLDASQRERLERVEVSPWLRVSALDWFEHEGRFDVLGSVQVQVEVVSLSLRSFLTAWLWPALARPDALGVRVRVQGPEGLLARFDWEEQTRVGGWEWRDADARLDRMARRLGRRIAELL